MTNMTTRTKPPMAQFIVRCPADRVEAMETALDRAGASCDPRGDQFFLHPGFILDGTFTGDQAPECIQHVNEHLEEQGSRLRITADYENLGWEQRHRLLAFLNCQVLWESEHDFPVQDIQQADLDAFARENPEMFQAT